MKRKSVFILIAAIFTLLLNVNIYAAETVKNIEGEDYSRATFTPKIVTGTGFSKGAVFHVQNGLEERPTHDIYYEFNLDKAGRYGLEVQASILNVGYTTDYTITINDGIEIPVASVAVKLADITTDPLPKVIKRYYVGNYYFKEGRNEVVFHLIDADRADTTGYVTSMIDCFTLTIEDFAINNVTTPKDCNVYEGKSRIKFNVEFKGTCSEELTYNYEIIDNWGTVSDKGKFICRSGSVTKDFYTREINTGHYTLKIFDENGKQAFRDVSFAVVPKMTERISGDSPFAMDFAGTDVVANVERVSKLSKAAKLAGVQWIRERFQWTRMQPKKEQNYKFSVTDSYIDAITKEGLKISDIFYGNPTWRKDTDLFDLYYATKAASERYKGKVNAWEMYNEVDGNFQSWTGDTYASILKAMAIGVKDGDPDAIMSFDGLCHFIEADRFIDLQTKNRAMDYSDIYNLHYHITENNELNQNIMLSHFKDHRALKFYTGTEEKPFWITEAGIYQNQTDGKLSEDQRQRTARYLVTSTVQSLSTGTSKHFWFILSPYIEAKKKDMGIFDSYYLNTIFDSDFCMRAEGLDETVDAVVVFGGTNDYGHGDAPLGNMEDRTVYTFYGACHVLMESLITKYPDKPIVFMTPLHRLGEAKGCGDVGKPVALVDYVNIIKEVAQYYSIPVLDLFSESGMQPNVEEQNKVYFADGLHPNTKGHARIAYLLEKFLKNV